MISIKTNDKPLLKVCPMKCDKGLDAKLDKYELSKFLNEHTTCGFIGAPKSGKTNLLYSLFKSPELLKGVFHNVFIFQPKSSRASMKDSIFDAIPENQQFEELNAENLNAVINFIKAEDCEYNSCIIFDDVGSQLKNSDTLKLLKQMNQNRRHLHLSLYFLQQTWNSMPKDIRKIYSNLFIFKCSKMELKLVFEELIEAKEKYMIQISNAVYTEPYKYLFVNVPTQRLFSGFDELLIKED